jgi:N-acetylmuramoyl-L-alanine amidase
VRLTLALLLLGCSAARADAVDCLADNIYFEAAFEPVEGKVAVANVTLNRAGGTSDEEVCGAVYAKAVNPRTGKKEAAFSWTLGARWRPHGVNLSAWAECFDIARSAIDGTLAVAVGPDVKFYHATYVHPRWHGMIRVAQIGHHIFYRRST